ncbi:MAG: redox-sensing transcriptional repressor Rex [Treponema sp.]|jgi:redox-sensing transcriptional repressor|nr:redox-sensing transcriptional repressor Rex [Treponema sp.]
MEQKISKPARERLIRLARLLEQFEKSGKTTVSSAEIQNRTGWTSFTIRRDVSMLGVRCANTTGYNVSLLKKTIRNTLSLGKAEKRCCIVGLGRLGEALAGFSGFANSSFVIVAGFDSNVNRTETLRAPFPLYSTSKMEQVIANEKIEYAILAVPETVAEQISLRLSVCGIRGIVNYTTAILHLPETTAVENLSVIDALQNLSCK